MPYFKTENSNAENIKYDNTKSVKEAIDEIKASSSSDPTASSVTFNNTDTGLNATNVQDAVTEVNGKLHIKYKAFTCTVAPNSASPFGYYGRVSKADCALSDNEKIISVSGYNRDGYPVITSYEAPSEELRIASNLPDKAYIHILYITL